MDTANPLLSNPLFVAAVLLFLVILPLALRQKKKSALDMVLDQYEKEETKTIAKRSAERAIEQETRDLQEASPAPRAKSKRIAPPVVRQAKPTQGETPSSVKPKPAEQENSTPGFGEVTEDNQPSFDDKGGIPFPDGDIQTIEESASLSHGTDSPPAARKKKKFTSEAIPISHNEEKVTNSDTLLPGLEKKGSPDMEKGGKWVEDFYASPKRDSDDLEPTHNWIEADIPGLIMDPPPEQKVPSKEKPIKKGSKKIPTFKAPEKVNSKAEKNIPKTKKSLSEEKGDTKVKNLDPKAEEKKTVKTEKQDQTKAEPPSLEHENPDSGAKSVEKETLIASHKNSGEKEDTRKAETEVPVKPVSPQETESKAPPKTERPKPFFLDLKYLIEEERSAAGPDAPKKLSPEMVDRIVARLGELQVNLENQLTSRVLKAIPEKTQSPGALRKKPAQIMRSGRDEKPEEFSDKKEVSLEELDAFLFTASQRKSSE